VIKFANGRLPSDRRARERNSTRDSIEAAKFAEESRRRTARCSSRRIIISRVRKDCFRHFKAIADATQTSGHALQHSRPLRRRHRTGHGCSIGGRVCRNILSIKEASGSVERVGELRRRLPNEFTILSGDDGFDGLPFYVSRRGRSL